MAAIEPHEEPGFRQLFWLLVEAEWAVKDIADGFGLSPRQVISVLGESPEIMKRAKKPRSWCPQCERRVEGPCSSPFCKALAKAA